VGAGDGQGNEKHVSRAAVSHHPPHVSTTPTLPRLQRLVRVVFIIYERAGPHIENIRNERVQIPELERGIRRSSAASRR
jgi:hypothetical protein